MNALADAAMSWPTKQPFIMPHAASDCRNCMVAGLNWNLTFTRHLIISSLFAALHGIHTLLRCLRLHGRGRAQLHGFRLRFWSIWYESIRFEWHFLPIQTYYWIM